MKKNHQPDTPTHIPPEPASVATARASQIGAAHEMDLTKVEEVDDAKNQVVTASSSPNLPLPPDPPGLAAAQAARTSAHHDEMERIAKGAVANEIEKVSSPSDDNPEEIGINSSNRSDQNIAASMRRKSSSVLSDIESRKSTEDIETPPSPSNEEESTPGLPRLRATLVQAAEATLIIPTDPIDQSVYEATLIPPGDVTDDPPVGNSVPWWKENQKYLCVALVSLIIGALAATVGALVVSQNDNNNTSSSSNDIASIDFGEESDDIALMDIDSNGIGTFQPSHFPSSSTSTDPATASTMFSDEVRSPNSVVFLFLCSYFP